MSAYPDFYKKGSITKYAEEPKWEDGSPATLEDYYKNQFATQSAHPSEKGLVTVLEPDLVAVTRFDFSLGHWVLYSEKDVVDLDITDPNVSDAVGEGHIDRPSPN
jgi:hypothetical protein